MLRRRLYKLHQWIGLVTGLLLLVVSLSGIPLLFANRLIDSPAPPDIT